MQSITLAQNKTFNALLISPGQNFLASKSNLFLSLAVLLLVRAKKHYILAFKDRFD
jgi:hypothetical protein